MPASKSLKKAEALEQPEILAQYRDIQKRIAAVLAQIQEDEEKL